jgi:hypothetical protein
MKRKNIKKYCDKAQIVAAVVSGMWPTDEGTEKWPLDMDHALLLQVLCSWGYRMCPQTLCHVKKKNLCLLATIGCEEAVNNNNNNKIADTYMHGPCAKHFCKHFILIDMLDAHNIPPYPISKLRKCILIT